MFREKEPIASINIITVLLSSALVAYEMKFDVDLTDSVLVKIKSSVRYYRNILKNSLN